MRWTWDQLVLAALAYADIFSYPLTRDELWLWLPLRVRRKHLALDRLKQKNFIETHGQSVVLAGRERCIGLRQRRTVWSRQKWDLLRRRSSWLLWIPTVRLVGVTGSLSMDNVGRSDDIDLCIVTSPGAVWVTRLVVTVVAEVLRIRRRPHAIQVGNALCFNMFMAADAMTVPPGEQDFYASHEVLQLVPVWKRGDTYRQFLLANRWVQKFLPNAWEYKCQMANLPAGKAGAKWPIKKQKKIFSIWHLAFSMLESIARALQLWYMQKRRTHEVISDSVLRFHPRDARSWIRRAYRQRLARYRIPLDKIFDAS